MTTPPLAPAYESEPHQRRLVAEVSAGAAWWAAVLTLPDDGSGAALLDVQRHGPQPAGYDAGEAVTIALPAAELPALAALVAGLARDAAALDR